jgi:YesN/AraC family two-component response regulator
LLAEAVYLHPTYISSLFKKETGITFIHFLHSYRIEQAKILMRRNPNLSINEVSIIVGYENPRHFFALFKKYNDLTPGKYRESLALHN